MVKKQVTDLANEIRYEHALCPFDVFDPDQVARELGVPSHRCPPG